MRFFDLTNLVNSVFITNAIIKINYNFDIIHMNKNLKRKILVHGGDLL